MEDQLNRTINLSGPPQRIISLVPSQTELLFDLGLDSEVIGITKFCIHPDSWFRTKTRVGGTKQLNLELIRSLQPDLIIANKEENTQEELEELMVDFEVWVSDIKTLNDAFDMIEKLGDITEHLIQAAHISGEIKKGFDKLNKITNSTAAYFIWQEPMMVAGADTFINEMMNYSGFKNVFDNLQRYPTISENELQNKKPDYILLSTEPFPFKEKHRSHYQQLCPQSRIVLVDGEFFSWYGSRLLKAPFYFEDLRKLV